MVRVKLANPFNCMRWPMGKVIVFCADGTWNGPGKDGDEASPPVITNVLKLFLSLKGEDTPETIMLRDEQEKNYSDDHGLQQVAKYLHGVGDSQNPLVKMMGGTLGAGTITRIVRGYTYLSRNYVDGDRIVLVGFSRGAYTARALAGFVVAKGLLNSNQNLQDKENAYRLGAAAWCAYRKEANAHAPWLSKFMDIVTDLPGYMSKPLPPDCFATNVPIKAVAVWDTVGALGIPSYAVTGQRLDTFQFASKQLSEQVEYGIHAISVDDERPDFTPTLWEDRQNVTQALFAGAHADVGGGYPFELDQCGLSDSSLDWMRRMLSNENIGVLMNEPLKPFAANALGTAHQPWIEPPWNLPHIDGTPNTILRDFSSIVVNKTLGIHRSVAARWGQRVRAAPDIQLAGYAPGNIAGLFEASGVPKTSVTIYE